MSAYSGNYFTGGYVEKGDTVYVLSQLDISSRPVRHLYSIQPYTVIAVGRKYLSAKASDDPARRVRRFGPLANICSGYGHWLEEVGTPLGDKVWRDCLFPSREKAEAYMKILEKRDAEKTSSGGCICEGGDLV